MHPSLAIRQDVAQARATVCHHAPERRRKARGRRTKAAGPRSMRVLALGALVAACGCGGGGAPEPPRAASTASGAATTTPVLQTIALPWKPQRILVADGVAWVVARE